MGRLCRFFNWTKKEAEELVDSQEFDACYYSELMRKIKAEETIDTICSRRDTDDYEAYQGYMLGLIHDAYGDNPERMNDEITALSRAIASAKAKNKGHRNANPTNYRLR